MGWVCRTRFECLSGARHSRVSTLGGNSCIMPAVSFALSFCVVCIHECVYVRVCACMCTCVRVCACVCVCRKGRDDQLVTTYSNLEHQGPHHTSHGVV